MYIVTIKNNNKLFIVYFRSLTPQQTSASEFLTESLWYKYNKNSAIPTLVFIFTL